jgi:hypothetical protein
MAKFFSIYPCFSIKAFLRETQQIYTVSYDLNTNKIKIYFKKVFKDLINS